MTEKTNSKQSSGELTGILYGAMAFTAWGLLPLYWKLLNMVPPLEILAHRIVWSFVYVSVLLTLSKRWGNISGVLKKRNNIFYILLCSVFIGMNWFIYIWAVNSNHVIETSMGYYINPLMSVLLGMLVLKERLNFYQYLALLSAAIGVVIVAVQYGKIPWVALMLAATFALYGLFKKLVVAESIVSLTIETAVLLPAALAFLTVKQVQGTTAMGHLPLHTTLVLLCAGVATATPLLWFAKGAKRVQLSTIGFLQYISPTITLLLGIFVFREPFTKGHVLSFGFIWAALVVFSLAKTGFLKNREPALFQKNVS